MPSARSRPRAPSTRDDPRAFAGVPIAIKSNVPVAGLAMEFGSRLLAGHRPGHSAYLVRRLRDAGFVVLGTTRMPEFGILPTTEPRHGGPVRNPWDLSRTPGGSSGGSAAAVAAGLVPIAHGNDGGGSIRIPAACCGLVGLKPSRGRISRGPDLGDSYLGADGVLSRTVAETALLLDVMAGYEPGDANWAPRPAEPFTATMQRPPGKLRIAMSLDNALGIECDADVVHGVHEAAAVLRDLGHEVEEAGPPVPEAMADLFIQAFAPHVALGIGFGERLAGRPPGEDEIEPLSRHVRDLALAAALDGLPRARSRSCSSWRAGSSRSSRTTTCCSRRCSPRRPLPIGELDGSGDDPAADLLRAGAFAPYTPLFNVTGQPAISIPIGFGDDGLPDRRAARRAPAGRRHAAPGRRADRGRPAVGGPHAAAVSFTPAHRGGAGAPLVLLHGFTDTWRTWELVLPALEARHDVLAPDARGPRGRAAAAGSRDVGGDRRRGRARDGRRRASPPRTSPATRSAGTWRSSSRRAGGPTASSRSRRPAAGPRATRASTTRSRTSGRCRSCSRARCRTSRRSSPRPRGGGGRPRTSRSTRSCSRPTSSRTSCAARRSARACSR